MSDYWEKRALERLLRIELIGDDYAGRIYRLYKNAFDELNGELSSLFDRYAEQGGLTPIEAAQYLREPVTRAQSDALMKLIDAIDDPDAKRKLLARANSAQYAARMKRVQAMQESIRAECAKVAEQEIAAHQEAARRIGTESYYRTVFDFQQGAGVSMPFAGITIDEIDAVLAKKWTGESYSARVWDNTSAMAQKLGEIVRTNVATGRPWERCVGELQEYMATPGQGGVYAAERLLRTETMHVYNEISAGASSSMGAKRYRFIAVLDLKTSELCRAHDGLKDPDTGKFYTYANRKPGVNFPPLHPWCRSTEAPYINADTLKGLTRPAKDPVTGKIIQVPATMTYDEWHKKYVEGKPEAELAEKMIKNTAGDRSQWQRYRGVLGSDAPKDLAAFQRMKYIDPVEWNRLKWDYRFEGRNRAIDSSELLANNTAAEGIRDKLDKYSLNPDHATGKNKAIVFKSALGFGLGNSDLLEQQIRRGLTHYKAVSLGDTGHGARFRVIMLVKGPNGKQPVLTGWIYDKGYENPRMVTAYVDHDQRP